MRNYLLLLVLLFTTPLVFSNSEKKEINNFKGEIVISKLDNSNSERISLTFTSLEDFDEFDSEQLNFTEPSSKCTASIEVKVTADIGVVSVSVTVKAEGIPCEKVKEKVEELKKAAKDALLS